MALKILRPGWLYDDKKVARFEREVRTAANLSHPNIATILDVGQANDSQPIAYHFLLMGCWGHWMDRYDCGVSLADESGLAMSIYG